MHMTDIIRKKRDGLQLSDKEIAFFIDGYVSGTIPDYQASALMMAIYFSGMTPEETTTLTIKMAESGDMADLSGISGIKADKHSTGGVGDKTTLIIAPIAAACGVKTAKMSGRGLGHTGGTIDKLESIPGFNTSIPSEDFKDIVNNVGAAIIGQSGNLCPADKMLYALRDVTATVESIPLIAASVMSKKIAAGTDCILLDVKTGKGAFMKTKEDSIKLAEQMVKIGTAAGRKTAALITSMDNPLGRNIGNTLEIEEAVNVLKGGGPADLRDLCVILSSYMVYMAGKSDSLQGAEKMVKDVISNGAAFLKLKEIVTAQGGDSSALDDFTKLPHSRHRYEYFCGQDGYISSIDAELCGRASVLLGAGREVKDDAIDHGAGIVLNASVGDRVHKGGLILTMYSDKEASFKEAEKLICHAYEFSDNPPEKNKILLHTVESKDLI